MDEMRGDLNDSEDGSPPQLRTDLLNLHPLAMAVVNRRARSQLAKLFDIAGLKERIADLGKQS